MAEIDQKCAALAAEMLDAELILLVRRLQGDSLTPFQQAAKAEAAKRNLTIMLLEPGEYGVAEAAGRGCGLTGLSDRGAEPSRP